MTSLILDDAPAVIAEANHFYRSFDAATCPATMVGEMAREATRDLISFYAAHADEDGRLDWFAKIMHTRTDDGSTKMTVAFHESYVYTVDGHPGLRRLIKEDGESMAWSLSPGRLVEMHTLDNRRDDAEEAA